MVLNIVGDIVFYPLVTFERERDKQFQIESVIKLDQGCYEHPGVCQNYHSRVDDLKNRFLQKLK